jgi:hypothetical protein
MLQIKCFLVSPQIIQQDNQTKLQIEEEMLIKKWKKKKLVVNYLN